jgi:membrane associated rhomboid family serine protease
MNKILEKYKTAGIIEKLIYLNVAAFLLTYLTNTLGYLFNIGNNMVFEWFSMPANLNRFVLRPWTIMSYGFLHGSFFHLLSNMFVLYYIGELFVSYFSARQLVSFYLYGTFFGGLLYLFSYNFFPALQEQDSNLVGASSAVMAIFVGLATYIPNYELRLRFVGYVKLWVLAAIFLGIDLIQIPSGNAGGHLAHLGGALFGYFSMRQLGNKPHKTKRASNKWFSFKKPLKTVYKSNKKTKKEPPVTNQEQIDHILDKISRSGYDSLNQQEKDLLFRQGKK